MKRRFKMFDSVVLERDLDDKSGAALSEGVRIPAGTRGAVVEFLRLDGLAVEFFDDEGETIDVAFIPESFVRAPTPDEARANRELNERLRAEPLR